MPTRGRSQTPSRRQAAALREPYHHSARASTARRGVRLHHRESEGVGARAITNGRGGRQRLQNFHDVLPADGGGRLPREQTGHCRGHAAEQRREAPGHRVRKRAGVPAAYRRRPQARAGAKASSHNFRVPLRRSRRRQLRRRDLVHQARQRWEPLARLPPQGTGRDVVELHARG